MRKFHLSQVLLGLFLTSSVWSAGKDGKYVFYAGTYTRGDSKGLYSFRFDSKTGDIEKIGAVAEVDNPSWVAIHPNGKFLYAVSELGNDGKSNGRITAFAIDPITYSLKMLNGVSSGGGGACHLTIDKSGKALM